ncbi:MAG: efflux RND transporter periplasmic adaptor subunit [candidate division WOR-3 bacterium]
MKKSKTIIIVIGVIIILGVIISLNLITSKPGEEVIVTAAKFGSILAKISATGELKAALQVNLQAQAMGTVDKLYVQEGDVVKKGQLLCQLDRKSYEADMLSAKARYEQAKAVYARNETLYARNLIAQEQFESYKMQYEVAKAQYEQAQDRLAKTKITAPISGTVVKVNIEEGETVIIGTMNNPGTVMMVIADLSQMLAIVKVDETDIPSIKLGQKAEITIDALPDTVFEGIVTKIGYMPVQNILQTTETGTDFEVEVKLTKTNATLKPGMTVSADIITAEKESVLVVPIQAVGKRKVKGIETQALFVVEKGVAKLKPVKTGSASETEIEIIEGIKPGDKVISGPYKVLAKLKDGVKVKTLEEKKS